MATAEGRWSQAGVTRVLMVYVSNANVFSHLGQTGVELETVLVLMS